MNVQSSSDSLALAVAPAVGSAAAKTAAASAAVGAVHGVVPARVDASEAAVALGEVAEGKSKSRSEVDAG